MRTTRITSCFLGFLLLASCKPDTPSMTPQNPASAVDTVDVLIDGAAVQTVYVPIYSHIYHQDGSREFNLTATLSIRNTDPEHPIVITAVRYYDSAGRLIQRYLEQPNELLPLASQSFVVEERDKAGGVGANFIVEWQAGVHVSSPIIEAVMISTASSQGISFVTRGQVVRPLAEHVNEENQP